VVVVVVVVDDDVRRLVDGLVDDDVRRSRGVLATMFVCLFVCIYSII